MIKSAISLDRIGRILGGEVEVSERSSESSLSRESQLHGIRRYVISINLSHIVHKGIIRFDLRLMMCVVNGPTNMSLTISENISFKSDISQILAFCINSASFELLRCGYILEIRDRVKDVAI